MRRSWWTALIASTAFAAEPTPQPPLGIVCQPRVAPWSVLKPKVDVQNAATARGDWAAAVEAARFLASEQCPSAQRWQGLASLLQLAGRTAEALEVASYALARWTNETAEWDRRNRQSSELPPLLRLSSVADSAFARRLAELESIRAARIARARERLARLALSERPARAFVSPGACPFECCRLGDWTATAPVVFHAAPGGAPLARALAAGEKVTAIDGEVHVRPRAVSVERPFTAERANEERVEVPGGTIVFELESIGEGFARLWFRGEIVSASTYFLDDPECLVIDDDCWGDALEPADREPPWWIKIRTADGVEGWTRELEFDGMSGCS